MQSSAAADRFLAMSDKPMMDEPLIRSDSWVEGDEDSGENSMEVEESVEEDKRRQEIHLLTEEDETMTHFSTSHILLKRRRETGGLAEPGLDKLERHLQERVKQPALSNMGERCKDLSELANTAFRHEILSVTAIICQTLLQK